MRIFLLPILGFFSGVAWGQPIGAGVHRVLFLGNSITYAGGYITDVEAYFDSRHPHDTVEFINLGLPSETVSGLSEPGHAGGRFPRPDLHERLHRILEKIHPDVIFACYGMNDGIYMPLDEERFQRYKEGMQWLHDTLVKATGARVIFLTPPVYDELRGGKSGYAEFGIDGFALTADGIHPGEVGHWLMARGVLLYLGEKEVTRFSSIKRAMDAVPDGEKILELVGERQSFMKDAWLTWTGHKRPDMKVGLPMEEARGKAVEIEGRLRGAIGAFGLP